MSILDTTIVNVALDTLHRDLHAGISEIQWVVTGYMLALAAVIPVSGWAARRFGPKNVYLLSLVLFTVGSALCGLAQSTAQLIIFRVLQGVGGGMILPIGQLMMAETAGPKRMGRVMALTSIPTMMAPILGPTIGGLIVQNMSWRWIFYVNVPIGVITVLLGLRFLPRVKASSREGLDVVGLGLMVTGLPLITYGLAEIGSSGTFNSPKVMVPLIVGTALVIGFVFHALRARRPLLQLHLYRRPAFAASSLVMFCLGAALFGAMILLPLYWQGIRHESVVDTGLMTSPQGLGMILVMPFVGRWCDRHGGAVLALFGVCVTALSTLPFSFVGVQTSVSFLLSMMFVRGMGMGFAFMPAMTAAFASLERSELSDATPQLNVLMRVGGSIGTAVLAVVLQRGLDGAHTLAQRASAYGSAFWVSTGLTALAILPCLVLIAAERSARRTVVVPPGIPASEVVEVLA
jgi:EmrB/QacA subfamily drug resistance transporter